MTILYYGPSANHSGISAEWIYGTDIIRELQKKHMDWAFVKMCFNSRWTLRVAYRLANCLLRPTRHNGFSYCVQEALFYGLPVLHTYPIPGVILIKPEIQDIEEKLLKLSEEI